MKPGDRIELVSTDDQYTDLRPGARGTVRGVDDTGTLHVDWDSGSRLGLVAEAGDRWIEIEDRKLHEHHYSGQTLRHAHTNGDVEHGYYEHLEDRIVRPKGWPNYPEEHRP